MYRVFSDTKGFPGMDFLVGHLIKKYTFMRLVQLDQSYCKYGLKVLIGRKVLIGDCKKSINR